jgi:hypothetical protein
LTVPELRPTVQVFNNFDLDVPFFETTSRGLMG